MNPPCPSLMVEADAGEHLVVQGKGRIWPWVPVLEGVTEEGEKQQ